MDYLLEGSSPAVVDVKSMLLKSPTYSNNNHTQIGSTVRRYYNRLTNHSEATLKSNLKIKGRDLDSHKLPIPRHLEIVVEKNYSHNTEHGLALKRAVCGIILSKSSGDPMIRVLYGKSSQSGFSVWAAGELTETACRRSQGG